METVHKIKQDYDKKIAFSFILNKHKTKIIIIDTLSFMS